MIDQIELARRSHSFAERERERTIFVDDGGVVVAAIAKNSSVWKSNLGE